MGWIVKQKDDKYRIYSTVIDDYLMGWSSRQTILKYILGVKYQDFIQNIIKTYMIFPHHCRSEAGKVHVEPELVDLHIDWMTELHLVSADQYYEEIDAKFNKVLCGLGVEHTNFMDLAELVDS